MTIGVTRRTFLERAVAYAAFSCCPLPGILHPRSAQAAQKLNTDMAPAALIADLQKFIPGLMEQLHVPGLSISVIRDSKILWAQGFGVTSVETTQPVTIDTPFEAASLSI